MSSGSKHQHKSTQNRDSQQQAKVVYPPGSRYSLTQSSPCQPIISEVLPHKLFISNIEGTADVKRLQKLGITHVLSVIKTKQTEPLPPPMKRLWVPIVDTANAVDGFEKAWPTPLAFLKECMETGGVALVHCRAGMSRSSTVVLVHLITYHKMTLRDAWTTLSSKHPIASPIIPFFRALIAQEERTFGKYVEAQNKLRELSIKPADPSSSSSSSSQNNKIDKDNKTGKRREEKASASSPSVIHSSSLHSSSSTSPSHISSHPSASSTLPSSSPSSSSPSSSSLSTSSSSSSSSLPPSTSSTLPPPTTIPGSPSPFSSLIPSHLPTITLLEYCLIQLHNIFPKVNEEEFYSLLQKSPLSPLSPFGHSWLTACRMYYQMHPDYLQSYAMKYGGGAAQFHPFCD